MGVPLRTRWRSYAPSRTLATPLTTVPTTLTTGPRYLSDGPDDLNDASDGLASRPPGPPHEAPNTNCRSNYTDIAQRLTQRAVLRVCTACRPCWALRVSNRTRGETVICMGQGAERGSGYHKDLPVDCAVLGRKREVTPREPKCRTSPARRCVPCCRCCMGATTDRRDLDLRADRRSNLRLES